MKNNIEKLVDYFFELKGWADQSKKFYRENKISYPRFCREAKELLELCNNNLAVAKQKLDKIKEWADSNGLNEWILGTANKKFLEIK